MGTVVLRSHDYLSGGLRNPTLALKPPSSRSRTKDWANPNRNPNPNHIPNSNQSRRRKRSPVAVHSNQQDPNRSLCSDRCVVGSGFASARNLVMGQVKILKRGEKMILDEDRRGVRVAGGDRKARSKSVEDLELVLGSTDRLGPDPETVQKQIRFSEFKIADGMYAGTAFVASPPPSSLPVPGFLGKNGAATSDLRRLLRIDLA